MTRPPRPGPGTAARSQGAHAGGLATEAATATIDWAFAELGWTEVVHLIDPGNAPSQGVARKLGSCNRGLGRLPPPLDANPIEIWGQTREEWLARRTAALSSAR